jgi:hypothetical protein
MFAFTRTPSGTALVGQALTSGTGVAGVAASGTGPGNVGRRGSVSRDWSRMPRV